MLSCFAKQISCVWWDLIEKIVDTCSVVVMAF